MELDWSEQSPHIRSLYRPWQPGDGYDEAEIEAAEARLGFRLPSKLRNFYLAWGRRRDLTEQGYLLLEPERLVIRDHTLLLCLGDQSIYAWGIAGKALWEADPPIMVALPGAFAGWEAEGSTWTASHPHLSSFLDDLMYVSAFCGGAIHGGWTKPNLPDLPVDQIVWLETQWNKATVTPLALNRRWYSLSDTGLPLYIRDGQALWYDARCGLAASEAEVVDEIAQRFKITWAERW